ncbi:diguanylate cyclase domain-containing protein [Arsukibacterium sp. MJ3]|uniref:diguanylate cyclase domain-containing protein n=1 Tax=Arsukibacterium sp. MJ3 TaxID=1632859 RepID=UPI0009E286C9|nr:diguanylate cyclase [Arsukibacterium sp. MJ3]
MPDNMPLITEQSRLAALQQLGLINTPPEERFDRITRLAKALFNPDIVLLTLLDEKTQYFKARLGTCLQGTARDISFCTYAILEEKILVIPDAMADPRFATNPLVTKEPYIRFYAGAVIRTFNGHALGTLCLLDSKPRNLTVDEQSLLLDLAKDAENEFQLHYLRSLQAEHRRLAWIAEQTANGVLYTDLHNRMVWCNSGFSKLCGYALEELTGKTPAELLLGPETNPVTIQKFRQHVRLQQPLNVDILYYNKLGKPFWVHVYAEPLYDEKQRYTGYISMQTDITERMTKLVEMERLAHVDPLTGLPNRRYFEEKFAEHLAGLQKNDQSNNSLALFVIDLDGFKLINDTYGHAAGDRVLIALAKRLKHTIRNNELLARIGGDEFALLAHIQHDDDVPAIAERIYQVTVQPLNITLSENSSETTSVKLDMSIGITLAPKHATSQAVLLQQADHTMYQAKTGGQPFLIFTDKTEL